MLERSVATVKCSVAHSASCFMGSSLLARSASASGIVMNNCRGLVSVQQAETHVCHSPGFMPYPVFFCYMETWRFDGHEVSRRSLYLNCWSCKS